MSHAMFTANLQSARRTPYVLSSDTAVYWRKHVITWQGVNSPYTRPTVHCATALNTSEAEPSEYEVAWSVPGVRYTRCGKKRNLTVHIHLYRVFAVQYVTTLNTSEAEPSVTTMWRSLYVACDIRGVAKTVISNNYLLFSQQLLGISVWNFTCLRDYPIHA